MVKKKYILAIIAILLCLSFCLAGCDKVYESGDFYVGFMIPVILMGVRAQTDTFSIDNVVLDLYYAFYNNTYPNPDGAYTHYTVSGVVFGLYICNKDLIFEPKQGDIIEDYKKLDNQYFVKEITEEEAFPNGYGYSYNRRTGAVAYDHSETITIPKEFFNEKSGEFLIKIYHFRMSLEYEGKYKRALMGYVELDYERLDENTVKLDFNKIRRK